jgi:hypothetical protein
MRYCKDFQRPGMSHLQHERTSTEPANEHGARTGSYRGVYGPSTAQLYEFSTAIEIFCTKTAQHVYAQCVGHPPNTH